MIGQQVQTEKGEFRPDIRKKFVTVGEVNQWNSCPGWLWVAQSWQCSKPGWIGPGVPGPVAVRVIPIPSHSGIPLLSNKQEAVKAVSEK